MIITIDGPAGSGKSTAAKMFAEKIKFTHFNAGNLYRAITAHLYNLKFDIENINLNSEIPNLTLKVELVNGTQQVLVNNINYTSVVRENHISTLVPKVSINKKVQETTQAYLKEFCNSHNVVIEGRGIGSSVLPNAELKFYLDCSIEERANRRFNEEKLKNNNISLEEIKQQIKERDELDKNRKVAPLVVPKNAVYLDTTKLSAVEVVEEMLKHFNK